MSGRRGGECPLLARLCKTPAANKSRRLLGQHGRGGKFMRVGMFTGNRAIVENAWHRLPPVRPQQTPCPRFGTADCYDETPRRPSNHRPPPPSPPPAPRTTGFPFRSRTSPRLL